MNDFHALTNEQKLLILTNAESKVGLPAAAIEKDLWVTCILQLLFSLDINADILFKGGTSLSKIGHLIQRFSEDIDIAINPAIFGFEGDITKKQLKKLRKESSLFVEQTLAVKLAEAIKAHKLDSFLTVEAEPDGDGDSTYPEPRHVFIRYQSLVPTKYDYLKSEVVLEVGARSVMEPTQSVHIISLVEECFPNISTTTTNPLIIAAAPEKTFLEKACLLHELFSTDTKADNANRRSRHLYDLEKMMDKDFAMKAICDNELFNSIQHHRSIYTSVLGVDYSTDFRRGMTLLPPAEVLPAWEADYKEMCSTMIYGEKLKFAELLKRIETLQNRFRNQRFKEIHPFRSDVKTDS